MSDEWAPTGIDVTIPNVARMYDYTLGGKDNFAADREASDRLIAAIPDGAEALRANRRFLGRAVRFVANQGIRQFIDLGSGLANMGRGRPGGPPGRQGRLRGHRPAPRAAPGFMAR